MRSVTRSRISRSWLTISIGISNSTVSQRSSVLMLARSRWLVGSSRIRMSGSSSLAAAAISISRCQPPDSSPNFLSRIPGSTPISSTSTSMRHQSSSWPTRTSASCSTSRTVLLGEARRHVLRHAADAKPARTDHLAGIELQRARQALQQGGLAGAVLADQRRARVVEQERDALEDPARAVIEGGALHPEHGLTRRHGRKVPVWARTPTPHGLHLSRVIAEPCAGGCCLRRVDWGLFPVAVTYPERVEPAVHPRREMAAGGALSSAVPRSSR